ncbi:MAG TPA: hypothetical protein VFZ88_06595, partial [Sphingomicrobium sp.]
KILAGGIGLAALASAAPAAAQYYPQPYPNYGYGQYGYGNQNPVGQIIGQILGYGRYPYGNYGYNQYSNQGAAIDQCARAVDARLNGYQGYYGYGNVAYQGQYGYGYNNRYNGARVQGITRIDRKSYGLKVRGVASSGYQGYDGYGRRDYGSYGYNAGADLSWSCEVRYDGRIRDIDISRRTANWRGY